MRRFLALLAVLALGGPTLALAQEAGDDARDGWPRWEFQLGAIDLDADPRVGIQLGESRPALVDFTRIGINDREVSFWGRGIWRFGEKWSLSMNAYTYDKSASLLLEEEIEFGDEVFPINANVESSLGTDILAVDLNRSLWRSESHDIGLGFGVHFIDFDIGITATGTAGNMVSVRAERADFLAPLPNFVAYAEFKPGENWVWRNRAGWFGLSINEYDGRMLTFLTSIEYRFGERFGLGAGYSGIDLDLDIEDDRVTEIYRVDYDGPFVFFSLQF